jgi:hypothetical protein
MADDFVSLLLEYSKDYESPTSFWKWSAYAGIAAAVKANVYLRHKQRKIYANTYTILLADSGKFRKGEPLKLIDKLLLEVICTKTFTGTASIQGILDKLSQDLPIKGKGITVRGGACLILASELASFFVEDGRLLPLLTDLHDYKEIFNYDLRSSTVTIKGACVSILAASNETFLREVYTQRANYGGLLRRTLLIKPDETRKPNSLFDPDEIKDDVKDKADWDLLIKKFTEISEFKGEVTMDLEAAKFWHTWYNTLYKSYDKYGGKTGFVEGIHALILKIALVISISKLSLVISKEDIEQAIMEVTSLRPNYEAYAMSSGRSEKAGASAFIVGLFWEAPDHKLHKSEILFKHWNEVSSEELDGILTTFLNANVIEISPNGRGEPTYILTKKSIDIMEEKLNASKSTNP